MLKSIVKRPKENEKKSLQLSINYVTLTIFMICKRFVMFVRAYFFNKRSFWFMKCQKATPALTNSNDEKNA